MKNLLFITLIAGINLLAGAGAIAADNRKAVGTWKLKVADAPYEYSTSNLTISEVEGKLVAKIAFTDGSTVKPESVSFANDILKFSVNIEGNDIPFNGKITGNSLSGSVVTPDGVMNVKGEKVTLSGSWDFTAPSAPYEYSTGKLIFSEANGKPTANVVMSGGYEIPVSDLKIDNLSFAFTVSIDYETVKVSGKLANGKITGKADSPVGIIDLTASRSKTEK